MIIVRGAGRTGSFFAGYTMNRPFYLIAGAYREESLGQLEELKRAALACGLRFFTAAEIERLGKLPVMRASAGTAEIPQNTLVYMDKRENPDAVLAVRAALSLNAVGAVMLFGNNPNRGYIRDGSAYRSGELRDAAEEAARLAPLFGRRLAQYPSE